MLRVAAPLITLCAVSFAVGTPAAAQSSDALMAKYPAGAAYKGKPAALNLASHKDARTFRTRLREAAAKGPNFAGYMTVAIWGCGTSCQAVALVDARNGRVYFGPTASAGVKHTITSRLLIVNPPEDVKEQYGASPPDYVKAEYYSWTNGRLVKVQP